MIKANELRIGNYFHPSPEVNGVRMPLPAMYYQVGLNSSFGDVGVIKAISKENTEFIAQDISPVCLTSNVVNKIKDLQKTNFADEFDIPIKDRIYIRIKMNGHKEGIAGPVYEDPELGTIYFGIVLEFLHQIQNLYFDLTGYELKILPFEEV